MKFTPNLTRREWKHGFIAMIVCLLILPGLLALALPGLSAARLNFVTYFLNAAVIVYVLRGFLLRNGTVALVHPFYCFYYACLGYMAQLAMGEIVMFITYSLAPGFVNLNDQTITAQLGAEFGLMVVTTGILAPIAEECFFRGLLFRGVYDRSPVGAWVLSVGLFAAVHVVGYTGVYDPLSLVLSFVQYLPAGIALCFAYHRGGTIFSPILTHAIINLMAVFSVAR